MADRFKERLKNPALRLAQEIAAERLKQAGVKLSPKFSRHPPVKAATEEKYSPELIRRLAGG